MDTTLPDCLPVPPSIRRRNVLEVTYCIERRSDHLWHQHTALFDEQGDELLFDLCSLNASDSYPHDSRPEGANDRDLEAVEWPTLVALLRLLRDREHPRDRAPGDRSPYRVTIPDEYYFGVVPGAISYSYENGARTFTLTEPDESST